MLQVTELPLDALADPFCACNFPADMLAPEDVSNCTVVADPVMLVHEPLDASPDTLVACISSRFTLAPLEDSTLILAALSD